MSAQMRVAKSGTILVTGGTGLIGRPLVLKLLEAGYQVRVLSRDAARASRALGLPVECYTWKDPQNDAPPAEALRGLAGVIHLAGESVGEGRWSDARKKDILNSRVLSTRQLVSALLAAQGDRPEFFVLGSAIGIYGDRGDEALDEGSSVLEAGSTDHGSAFLARVCREWEAEVAPLPASGIRVCTVRTGLVLARDGGALAKLLPVFNKGAGGPTGSGRQWMSWIHLDDIVGIFAHLADERGASGVFNGTAPEPETNIDFGKKLGAALGKPAFMPAPAAALKAALGEMADLVLTGQKVLPKRVLEAGYAFRYTKLEDAFEQLCGGRRRGAEVLEAVQWVPEPIEKVFEFFCDEKNLERITPPFLNFKVLGKSTPEIGEGTLIDYQLKLHGLPLKWRTLIERWRPNESFVDRQLKGPYTRWEHTHAFRPLNGGTLMTDEVLYRLPMGVLGNTVAGGFVRGDVTQIFEYRKKVINELFPVRPA